MNPLDLRVVDQTIHKSSRLMLLITRPQTSPSSEYPKSTPITPILTLPPQPHFHPRSLFAPLPEQIDLKQSLQTTKRDHTINPFPFSHSALIPLPPSPFDLCTKESNSSKISPSQYWTQHANHTLPTPCEASGYSVCGAGEAGLDVGAAVVRAGEVVFGVGGGGW
jgi:hypothetical protein